MSASRPPIERQSLMRASRRWPPRLRAALGALLLAVLLLASAIAGAESEAAPSARERYVTAFMQTLAGAQVTFNESLRPIFTRILARQLDEQQGQLSEGGAFVQLAQVFTFILSPPGNRPAGPFYEAGAVTAARNAANAAIATTTGSLQVTLQPAEAVAAGAQWRRSNTDQWFASGATESGIPIGGQTVEFRAISDWTTPNNMAVSITAGQTTTLTGRYSATTVASSVPTKWLFKAGSRELWMTDGTEDGTDLVMSLGTFGGADMRSDIIYLDEGKAIFFVDNMNIGDDWLWRTDGSPEGTHSYIQTGLVWNFPREGEARAEASGGRFMFKTSSAVYDDNGNLLGDTGWELGVTDGTEAGTRLIDINPVGGSDPEEITSLGNGKVIFSAYHPITDDREPWVSDGTESGTMLLKDIAPLDYGSRSRFQFTPLGNGKAIFIADDGVHGEEPWVTDGTPEGTFLINDIFDSQYGSIQLVSLGDGRAVFQNHYHNGLYVSDGTAQGTNKIHDGDGLPFHMFSFCDGRAALTDSEELWVTDGTAIGTVKVADFGKTNRFYDRTCLGNGLMMFMAQDEDHGWEPWISDGTPSGTKILMDIWPGKKDSGSEGINYQNMRSFGNGSGLFWARSPFVPEGQRWITDGTAEGTIPLKEVNPVMDNIPMERVPKLYPIEFHVPD